MKCPWCDFEVSDDSQFCPNCGINIHEYKDAVKSDAPIQNNKSNTKPKLNGEEKVVGGCILSVILGFTAIIAIGAGLPFEIILTAIIFIGTCILAWKLASMAKNIVVSVGRKTLDFLTVLDVILCVIVIVLGFIQCVSEDGISPLLWWYILGAIVLFFGTLLANYTLYLLIDIRDSLKKLSDTKGE